MKKLDSYTLNMSKGEKYEVGRSLVYIPPDRSFSVKCRVIFVRGDTAYLEPLGEKVPIQK